MCHVSVVMHGTVCFYSLAEQFTTVTRRRTLFLFLICCTLYLHPCTSHFRKHGMSIADLPTKAIYQIVGLTIQISFLYNHLPALMLTYETEINHN